MHSLCKKIVMCALILGVGSSLSRAANYYVNDNSTSGDVYCSAVGNDGNSGTAPNAPMLTITNLIAQKDLEPGDVVYIDTGTYAGYTISVGSADEGAVGNYVTFQGSTNEAAGGTVINRGSAGANAIQLNGADYVELRSLQLSTAQAAIFVDGNSVGDRVVDCRASGCLWGLRVNGADDVEVVGSIFYNNSVAGYLINSANNCSLDRSILYDNPVHISEGPGGYALTISNSVFVGGISFSATASTATGDHNVFWETNLSGEENYGSLMEFQLDKSGWWGSIFADPGFVDADSGDFHPVSITGHYDPVTTNWVADTSHSVLIDFADSADPYAQEPAPHGTNMNAGAYGNTVQASKSRTTPWLLALTGNDGGPVSGTANDIYWKHGNFPAGANVKVEYSVDNGGTWNTINASVAVTAKTVNWDVSGLPVTSATWRVVSLADGTVFDQTDQRLSVNGGKVYYYVNDTVTAGDVYTTAVGSDANDGASPATPMQTLTNLLAAYSLSGSDQVFIDTGDYAGYQIDLTGDDAGSAAYGYMTFQGSTNWAAGGSVIDRNANSVAMLFEDADYIELRDLRIVDSNPSVSFTEGSDQNICRRVLAHARNTSSPVFFVGFDGGGSNRFEQCAASVGATGFDAGDGIGGGHVWSAGVLYNNTQGIDSADRVSVSNSVIVGGTAFISGPPVDSDYNIFWSTDLGFDTLVQHQKAANIDWHSTVADPLFADPANDDFHPQSSEGHYDEGTDTWVLDAVDSPVIDFAAISYDYTQEPDPNGSQANIGVWGNSPWASKSRTNLWLDVLSYNDGGTLSADEGDTIYWNGNLTNGQLVKIELSLDGGVTWSLVEQNILASDGSYSWANTNLQSSSQTALWRVVYQTDTNITDESDSDFTYKYGGFTYYVNDNSLSGDIYTTAVGSDINPGTSPGTPKATLQSVFDTYDLEPGDTIWIDTGSYSLAADQTMTVDDAGSTNGAVSIIGSTNEDAGGTVLRRAVGQHVLALDNADYVDISYVIFESSSGDGLFLQDADAINIDFCIARRCASNGFHLADATDVTLNYSVAATNQQHGVELEGTSDITVRHSVFWNNEEAGLKSIAPATADVKHSVIVSSGIRSYCYYATAAANIVGNYNDLYAPADGVVGYLVGSDDMLDTLTAWYEQTGQEVFSISADPIFADVANSDFHVKSTIGRKEGASWVLDLVDSPLIDAGDPADSYANEPPNNGDRVNIGLYGDTDEASKSRSTGWVQIAYPVDGGSVSGMARLNWVVGGVATGQLMKIELSTDGGASWFILANNVAATDESLSWDTTVYTDIPAALWRIESTTDSSIKDATTNFFSIRNAPLSLYVNDTSTAGDVYTTAPGDANNLLATAAAPLDSLARLLDLYDLEPGDTVYVDTGVYADTTEVTFSRKDGGKNISHVTIEGSSGGVLIDNSVIGGGAGLAVLGTRYLDVVNVSVTNADASVEIDSAESVLIEEVRALDDAVASAQIVDSTNIFLRAFAGIDSAANGIEITDSTVHLLQSLVRGQSADAVKLSGASTLLMTNTVLEATGAGNYLINNAASVTIKSDYNDLYAQSDAAVALVGSQTQNRLIQWQEVTTNDLHSLSHDPLFADIATRDFHPKTTVTNGRFVDGAGYTATDGVDSPLIDAGIGDFALETAPNGSRKNIGPYGNSTEASLSRTNGWLLALTLNDGGSVRGTNTLYWLSGGAATGHTLTLEYSTDNGSTWNTIITGLAAGTTSYLWDTELLGTFPLVLWRVVSEVDGAIDDETDNQFAINNSPLAYYVNDASTVGDVYTSTVGASGNTGLSTNSPMLSIQEVLNTYSVRPGETIYVDTGLYVDTTPAVVSGVAGSDTNRLTIQGSTNYAAGGSVLDFGSGGNGISINQSFGIQVADITIQNAGTGIYVNESQSTLIRSVQVLDSQSGFIVFNSQTNDFEYCVARGNTGNGLNVAPLSDNTTWRHGICWSNSTAIYLASIGGSILVENSVLGALDANQKVFYDGAAGIMSDYNNIVLRDGAIAGYASQPTPQNYNTVSAWALTYGQDLHSLSHDPLFADENIPDYHLKTQLTAGRFVLGAGYSVEDTATSPMIDAGTGIYTNETAPNGIRANIGLYGNSGEASLSPTNARLTVLSLNDGGVFEGTNNIYWLAGGNATGQTVTISYSADGGISFSNIVTGVDASLGQYNWTSTLYQSSAQAVWRVVSEQEGTILDTNDTYFVLHNDPLKYYVNDASTVGDIYCSAVGSSANSGVASNIPKASIQEILDTYDLEPGDIIYVDTGAYTNSTVLTVTQYDGGDTNDLMTIQGSTNLAAGGSTFYQNGFRLDEAAGVGLRHLNVESISGRGFDMFKSEDCQLEWLRVINADTGYRIDSQSQRVSLKNNLASGCSQEGLYNQGLQTDWQNGVLWSNLYGVYMASGSLTVENSIIAALADGQYAYGFVGVTPTTDYNGIYLLNNGRTAYRASDQTAYETVTRWSQEFGQDLHTRSGDPLVADPGNNDFHLQTEYLNGRYVIGAGYSANDAQSSMMLDAGNPASGFSDEPSPNGDRINIGLYGASGQASKTPTNAHIYVTSLNDGGWVSGTVDLNWVATGVATGHTVNISYSADGGITWTTVATGVSASNGTISWDSTLFTSTALGVWRIEDATDPSVTAATNEIPFALRNTNLVFYVNDASVVGDVYSSAIGSAANNALTPATPMDSVQLVLDTYDLEAGDIIYIDTGDYTAQGVVTIGVFDKGGDTGHVELIGSTNVLAGGSVFDGFLLDESSDVRLANLELTPTSIGVEVLAESDNILVEQVNVNGGATAFSFTSATNGIVRHSSARNTSSRGVYVSPGSSVTVEHSVCSATRYAFDVSGDLAVSNSIMNITNDAGYVYYMRLPSANIVADYNAINLGTLTKAGILKTGLDEIYESVSRWSTSSGQDTHTLTEDILFVDEANGDFHLQSIEGRYDPATSTWINDAATSLLIDAGAGDFASEQAPNGSRANIGQWGATGEASQSPTNSILTPITFNDGGIGKDTVNLTWAVQGDALAHTVTLEFSDDGGATWSTIAAGLPASDRIFAWDTSTVNSTVRGVWRLTSDTDGSVTDATDELFSIRNIPIAFYVNDTSLVGDVYTTAIGSPLNTGTTPGDPLDSLYDVLDRWDVEPGDTIYVDTGVYVEGQTIVFDRFDAWDSSSTLPLSTWNPINFVTVQGSTNEQQGGSVIRRSGSGNLLEFQKAPGVMLKNLEFQDGTKTVLINLSSYISADFVRSGGGETAYRVSSSQNIEFTHCVASESSKLGLDCFFSSGVVFQSGVLWSNDIGADIWNASLDISETAISSFGEGTVGIQYQAGTLSSDYNNIYPQGGALAGTVISGGLTSGYETVTAWFQGMGVDEHSLSVDPVFNDGGAGDFHLKSAEVNGRYDPVTATWVTDTETSPLIDAGDPATTITEEPAPNGSRINIGLYGDSTTASLSPTNSALTVVTLKQGGTIGDNAELVWNATGNAAGGLVYIEYSEDNGATWTTIATNYPASPGSYSWDTSSLTPTVLGLWRVTLIGEPAVQDVTDVPFILRPGGAVFKFYVNNTYSVADDVYTTAAGNPANSGSTPADPKDSIQDIIDTYKLQPGDEIYVDTDTYTLSSDIKITGLDSGLSNSYISIIGSTNFAAGGTVLDRILLNQNVSVIELSYTKGISLNYLTLRQAGTGLLLDNVSNCSFDMLRSENHLEAAYFFNKSADINLSHSLAWDIGMTNGVAFRLNETSPNIDYCLAWDTFNVTSGKGSPSIHHSILQARGEGKRIFNLGTDATSPDAIDADYNNYILEDGAYIGERTLTIGGSELYPYLYDWKKASTNGIDVHTLSHDPLFVAEVSGDFHLKSENGHATWSGGFVPDAETSPSLDTGDRSNTDYTAESAPNGSRVNIGPYAGTGYSSRSITTPWVLAVSINSGGLVSGTNTLYWTYGNIPPTGTVNLSYSRNDGINWDTITNGIPVTNEMFSWDTTLIPTTALALWRVESVDFPAAVDQTDENFLIKNNPLTLYVNDASQVGDIYCTAPGSSANDGLSPATPLDDPAEALSLFSLSAGDIMYIDTGYYDITNSMSMDALNQGVAGLPIVIIGSTNEVAGGTVIDRGTPGEDVINLDSPWYIDISHVRLTGGLNGLYVKDVRYGTFSDIRAYNNATNGFNVGQLEDVTFDHCVAYDNTEWGIANFGLGDSSWSNCVSWNNASGAVRRAGSGTLNIVDSILGANSPESSIYHLATDSADIKADYNVLFTTNGAAIGINEYYSTLFPELSVWQRSMEEDLHSIFVDPLFADAAGGDFHVVSQEGRYDNTGAWVVDTDTSWAIDVGQLTSVYTNELSPNGDRINVGTYGNTSLASLSYTNDPALLAGSLGDGGLVTSTQMLYWVSRGLSPTNTVTLEYSPDGGITWVNIVNGLPITQDGYLWDVSSLVSTPLALWRVVLEADNSIWDSTEEPFRLRAAPLAYYVNDAYVPGDDVYTTASGNVTNTGLSADSPKDNLQDILDYDLEPGDKVYIDTGLYSVTNPFVLNAELSGTDTNWVYLISSTNMVAGGSVFTNQIVPVLPTDPVVAFDMNNAQLIDMSYLVLDGFNSGVSMYRSYTNSLSHSIVRSGSNGVSFIESEENIISYSVFENGTGSGITSSLGGTNEVDHCVMWNNELAGVYLYKAPIIVQNSIISAINPGSYGFYLSSNAVIQSDYNGFYLEDGLVSRNWNNDEADFLGLPQWTAASDQDVHSFVGDPLFVDVANSEYHLQSEAGHYDPVTQTWITTDTATSALIDGGTGDFANEPAPNGNRANIGLYGDTGEASKSRTNLWIQAVTANGGGRLEGDVPLVWYWGPYDAGSAELVNLEYSADSGATWTTIATNRDINEDPYLWDTTPFADTHFGRWRVSLVSDSTIVSTNEVDFMLRNGTFEYFVNDTVTTDDTYTTQIGDDVNTGVSNSAPVTSIAAILDRYEVLAGDTIYLDSGTYMLTATNPLVFGVANSGAPGNPITIKGNTNDWLSVIEASGTTLETNLWVRGDYVNLDSLAFGGGVFNIDGEYTVSDNLYITNAEMQVYGYASTVQNTTLDASELQVRGDDTLLDSLWIRDASSSLSGTNIIMRHSLVTGVSTGMYVAGDQITLINNTMIGPQTAINKDSSGTLTLNNNIIIAQGAGNYCVNMLDGSIDSDYNNLIAESGAWVVRWQNKDYDKLMYWQGASGYDTHSLSTDSLFVDTLTDNYHVQSMTGHWTPTGFVADLQHSPCIDAGNPLSPYAPEQAPNGGRNNIGAYGDDEEASLSLTNQHLQAISLMGGGAVFDSVTLNWNYSTNIPPGSLIKIEYSDGTTWYEITNGIPVDPASFVWNTTNFPDSFTGSWRISLASDTNISSFVDGFALRNNSTNFYVNDISLLDDVYCTAIGGMANDGLTPTTPMDSIQRILDTYDTIGGDTIYVDTGDYDLMDPITVIWSRGGNATTGYLNIIGSTNWPAGGTRLHALSTANNVMELQADYVSISSMEMSGGDNALFLDRNYNTRLTDVSVISNNVGVYVNEAIDFEITQSRLWDNTQDSIYLDQTLTSRVENCVIGGDTITGINFNLSNVDTAQNNIFYMTSAGCGGCGIEVAAYGGSASSMDAGFIDYNVYYFTDPAIVFRAGVTNMYEWQAFAEHDYRGQYTDPNFASVANRDFHLLSTIGRYDGSTWVTDATDAWGLDTGNPYLSYANEPDPNGGRINIGAYGNTSEASQFGTNQFIMVRALDTYTYIDADNHIQPLMWHAHNLPSGTVVQVDVSLDEGATWTTITNNVDAYEEYVVWTATAEHNTTQGLWRVIASGPWVGADTNDSIFDVVQDRADLVVDKAGAGIVNYLQTSNFVISISNAGPTKAENVVVEDTWPEGLEYISHSSTGGGTYVPASGQWSIPILLSGSVARLTVDYVPTNTPMVVTNRAEFISALTFDPETNNNWSTAEVEVPPAADIEVTKEVDDPAPSLLQIIDFTITVTNNGPLTSTNVVISDVLPSGLAYNSDDTGGNYNPVSGDWTIGAMVPGDAHVMHLFAVVTNTGTIVNTADMVAASNTYDPDVSNSVDTASINVGVLPEIRVLGTNGLEILSGSAVASTNGTDYGTLTSWNQLDRTFKVTNPGSGTLLINNVTVAGANPGDFSVISYPTTLDPGVTNDLVIRFQPLDEGWRRARVELENNSVNVDPYVLNVHGTGIVSKIAVIGTNGVVVTNNAAATIDEGTDFGGLDITWPSIVHTLTITNAGDATLSISSLNLTGDTNDFAVTYPVTIAPHSVSNLVISFDPQVGGVRTANIVITNNALASSPYTFTVQGTGITVSAITVLGTNGSVLAMTNTPDMVNGTDFGSHSTALEFEDHTYTITNSGTAILNISDVVIGGTGAGNYSIVSWPATVDPGTSSDLIVRFDPVTVGVHTGVVQITNDSDLNPLYEFSVTGTGTVHASLLLLGVNNAAITNNQAVEVPNGSDFGNLSIADPGITHTFGITNSGTGVLTISGVTTNGAGAGAFSVTGLPSTVPAGGIATFNVTFDPSVSGLQIAQFAIQNDGAINPYLFNVAGTGLDVPEMLVLGIDGTAITNGSTTVQLANGTAFGTTNVGDNITRTFVITNTSPVSLDVDAPGIIGSTMFSVVSYPATLAAGATGNLVVQFSPTAAGSQTATVSITNSSPVSPYTFDISGTGVDPATIDLTVTGNGLLIIPGDMTPSISDDTDYGTTGILDPITHTFKLDNTGASTVNITAINLTGAGAAMFNIDSAPTSLAPGASGSLQISFDPELDQTYTTVVEIVNDGLNPSYQYAIQGSGNYTNLDMRIVDIYGSGEDITIKWRAPLGPVYQVEYTTDSETWFDVPYAITNLPVGQSTVDTNYYFFTWTDNRPHDPYGIYRIRVGTWVARGDLSVLGIDNSVITNGTLIPDIPPGTDYQVTNLQNPITNVFKLVNSGIEAMDVTGIHIIGEGRRHFVVDSFSPIIMPGATGELSVVFWPRGNSTYTATVEIANNTLVSSYRYTVRGEGTYDGLEFFIFDITESNGNMRIDWEAPKGPLYQVEYSEDMETWEDIPLAFTNNPYYIKTDYPNVSYFTYEDPRGTLDPHGMYRVRIANPTNYFEIISLEPVPSSTNLEIQWLGKPGVTYTVEATADMVTWLPLGTVSAPYKEMMGVSFFRYSFINGAASYQMFRIVE